MKKKMNYFQSEGLTFEAPGLDPAVNIRRVNTDPEVDRTEDVVRPISGPVNMLP
ncbi:MAG: hypothetical protein HRT88_22315, partial [Lentisphaeraceae bacterium]|nr:hypothetical protein [Lentisphaeraceae bacterium]